MIYQQNFAEFLDDLRSQKAFPGAEVMTPGDREWKEQERRINLGIPVDPTLWQDLQKISEELGGAPLQTR